MNFYCYKAPGTRTGVLRTQEAFCEYAKCGMTAVYLTGANSFCFQGEEEWYGSNTQKCFEYARNAGIERIIMRDNRLYIELIEEEKLIGENGRFRTETELDEYVRNCMKPYAKEKGFYGLGLRDEPTWRHVENYGLVYRSIKRVAKEFGHSNIYIQMNLNPMIVFAYPLLAPNYEQMTEAELYEKYVDAYLTATGADLVSVDNYPFRPTYTGGRFLEGYYSCFQILLKQCRKHGARLAFVLQSFELIHKTLPTATAGYRKITSVNEMFLQMNSVLGFGVRDISFYTYEPDEQSEESPYRCEDSASFVTRTGEKNAIWYYGKAVIEHAKALEPILCQYDYVGSRIVVHESVKFCEKNYLQSEGIGFSDGTRQPPSAPFDNSHTFACLKNFSNEKDVMLITELKNNDGHLYMVQNIIDSPYKHDLGSMKFRLQFKHGCKVTSIFRSKVWEEILIADGVLEEELVQGEAIWITVSDK